MCNTCGSLFLNKFNLDRHMRTIHKIQINVDGTNRRKEKEKSIKCNECASLFGSRASLYRHKVANHEKALIRRKSKSTSSISENTGSNSFTDDDVINCRNILVSVLSWQQESLQVNLIWTTHCLQIYSFRLRSQIITSIT